MYEQLSIFDWMPTLRPGFPDINDIPEEEAVRIVGENLGIVFTHDKKFRDWRWKRGRLRLSMEYGHFTLDDNHDLFLGTGYEYRGSEEEGGYCGGASPCSGIEETINWFKSKLERYT